MEVRSLASSFQEKLYNRGPGRTSPAAAEASTRRRAFLTVAEPAGAPREARSGPDQVRFMPRPPRFSRHLPATPREVAGFPHDAAASTARRPGR